MWWAKAVKRSLGFAWAGCPMRSRCGETACRLRSRAPVILTDDVSRLLRQPRPPDSLR